jgi:hypothetical protein
LFGIVFGLGSLHAILHALVFTVGLGVARSITGIAIVQAARWIWPSAHRSDATPADGGGQNPGQANPRPAPAFSFLATPHLYPVGTSVWAAWLIQAADGPLLVDLATLPGFLLLVAACTGLRHLLGGRPGVAWAPWFVLFIFSSSLLRGSIQMSADLFYASTFLAVVAVLASVWHERRVEARHLAWFALSAGMLSSTKTAGAVSLVVVSGI